MAERLRGWSTEPGMYVACSVMPLHVMPASGCWHRASMLAQASLGRQVSTGSSMAGTRDAPSVW
jgi:hypothetical protein